MVSKFSVICERPVNRPLRSTLLTCPSIVAPSNWLGCLTVKVNRSPFLDVSVFARGLLHRVVTRIYFDPADVPEFVPEGRRATLVAQPDGEDRWRFDIRLQGEGETVFFAL